MFVEKFVSMGPEVAKLGPLFKSSQPVELTESETEYVVQCIKHVFPNHLMLQFDCTNTLDDQLLGTSIHSTIASVVCAQWLQELSLIEKFCIFDLTF